MNTIKSNRTDGIKPYLEKLHIPEPGSHKGQNGKLLVVGGSNLFHAASIWAAEIASHFVDMVHYCSTDDNNDVVKSLKGIFRNGIVVSREHLEDYAKEDDAILVGPGLVREGEEADLSKRLVKQLIDGFRETPIIFDAGAIQVMEAEWLKSMSAMPIVTPHLIEYRGLFGEDLSHMTLEEKVAHVKKTAHEYRCVILLKAVVDIISDGTEVIIIEGGNAGLTKGGTGDILAGLVASLRTKHDPLTSSVLASYLLKRTADRLFEAKGTWYNNSDLISSIPDVLKTLI